MARLPNLVVAVVGLAVQGQVVEAAMLVARAVAALAAGLQ